MQGYSLCDGEYCKINKKNVCFLIPIHPKHFSLVYEFIKKCKIFDIFLIFSSEKDYDQFEMKNGIKKIVIPENVITNSIVTYKKFWALDKVLKNSYYDYIIACDSETDVIEKNFTIDNVIKKIESFFYHKRIYGGKVDDDSVIEICKCSANRFEKNIDTIMKETDNFSVYTWWSDIPVYRKNDLIHFFQVVDYTNLEWNHFDHMIYQYYLILYHNFTIIKIDHNWSLEGQNFSLEKLEKLKKEGVDFNWIIPSAYKANKNFYENNGTFLLYHLDR